MLRPMGMGVRPAGGWWLGVVAGVYLELSAVPARGSAAENALSPAVEAGLAWLTEHETYLRDVAIALWERPETAHQEVETTGLLTRELGAAGFRVRRGVAGLPTAFVAGFGSGRPRMGIVALLDALPGLSQEREQSTRKPIATGGPGHGCGHNLIGAADLGAVLAVKEVLVRHELPGRIELYGAPAEEIYHGGVYMVREGVFDDLDALLFWHPSSLSVALGQSGLAMDSVRFVFWGRPSDATDAADKGINALQAVESFVAAVDGRRSHWPPHAVVNHVLVSSDSIPSVVPESAAAWFFLHARDRDDVDRLTTQVSEVAQATATRTGTRLEIQILSRTRHWLINRRMTGLLDEVLRTEDPPPSTEEERRWAHALRSDFEPRSVEPFFEGVAPLRFEAEPVPISDDTAEASWVVPRGGFLVACFPAEVPSHTWQWTASAVSGFAIKGMMRAARTLVRATLLLMSEPETLRSIRREFDEQTGGRRYVSPLPSGQGPFEYLTPAPMKDEIDR